MKKSDKIRYLRKMLEIGVSEGLCACVGQALPIMDVRDYLEFRNFVLSFHKKGLNKKGRLTGYLRGVADPYTSREGREYRFRLIKRAIKSLETPKKRPTKKAAKKKAQKR